MPIFVSESDWRDREIERLRQQRDDLLAACKLALKRIGAPIAHAQDALVVLRRVVRDAEKENRR